MTWFWAIRFLSFPWLEYAPVQHGSGSRLLHLSPQHFSRRETWFVWSCLLLDGDARFLIIFIRGDMERVFVTDGRRVSLVLIIKKNSFLYFNVNFYSFCHPRASVSFTSDPDFSSRSSCCRLNNIKCCPNGTTTTAVLKKKNPRRTSGRWCHWTDPFDECVSLSLSHFSRGMIQMPIMKWKWFNKKLNEIEWGIWKNRSAIDPIVGFSPQCTQESLFPYPSFLKLSFICFSLLSFLFYSQRLRTWRWILKRAFGFSRAAN